MSENSLTGPRSGAGRRMLSVQLVGMAAVLVVLVITCHWCQARRLLARKLRVTREGEVDTV